MALLLKTFLPDERVTLVLVPYVMKSLGKLNCATFLRTSQGSLTVIQCNVTMLFCTSKRTTSRISEFSERIVAGASFEIHSVLETLVGKHFRGDRYGIMQF